MRHGVALAIAYWGFSVASFWSIVPFISGDILSMVRIGNIEVALGLIEDTDQVLSRKFQRLAALRYSSSTFTGNLWVVDGEGKTIASTTPVALPPYWNETTLPKVPMEPALHNIKVGALRPYSVTLFRANPVRYLISAEMNDLPVALNKPTSAKRIGKWLQYFMLWHIFAVAFLSTITVLYAFRYKARQAKRVMSAIEEGNLKSRFTVTRVDEIGGLMVNFNRMAETIELLVSRLKTADQARKSLLQELNHDLRTPLTSLHLMVETLSEYHGKFSPKKRGALIGDVAKELDYVTRLVTFLFSLSEMEEASYRVDFSKEDLCQLLGEEVEHRSKRETKGRHDLEWTFEAIKIEEAYVDGDRSLLSRLIRNSLDNAAKFAKKRVHVSLTQNAAAWMVEIFDDGPGPSPEALERFGKRQLNPKGLEVLKPETSIGLGSAIMAAVAELHGGSITLGASAKPWGAVVVFSLPHCVAVPTRRAA